MADIVLGITGSVQTPAVNTASIYVDGAGQIRLKDAQSAERVVFDSVNATTQVAAQATELRTALGVPALSGDVFTGPIEFPGAALGWHAVGNSATPIKYLIAELEGSDDGNSMSRITIEGVLDRGWFSSEQRPFRLDIATRNGLRCFFSQGGAQIAGASIEIYLGPDSRYYVWLNLIGWHSASIFMRDALKATIHRETALGTPSGTLVFSTATAVPRRTDYYTLKFSGTSAATQGGSVSFAHGLSDTRKIKSLSVIALDAPGNIVSSNMPAQFGVSFCWLVGPTYIYVQNVDGASANMLSRPIYITVEVWY